MKKSAISVGIIGAGHNGLVCAGYLAKQGFAVTVYEKRNQAGGLCITEEIFPGYQVSSLASYYGMLREEIIEDLKLKQYGLNSYMAEPYEIILMPRGQYVYSPSYDATHKLVIEGLNESEINRWEQFWSDISLAASLIRPFHLKSDTTQKEIVNLLYEFGLDRIADTIFDASFIDLISQYVSNKELFAAAATTVPGFPTDKGTVYGCIYDVTANAFGKLGAWGFVKGGMGNISQALNRACSEKGVKVFTNCGVKELKIDDNTVTAMHLENGDIVCHDIVISNTNPLNTFARLISGNDQLVELAKLSGVARRYVTSGKAIFALKGLPPFPILDQIGHNYAGFITITPDYKGLIEASTLVANGMMPKGLMLSAAFPSVTDKTLVPAGQHLFNVDIHQMPITCNKQPWDKHNLHIILDSVLQTIQEYSPSFRDYIIDSHIVSPGNLQQAYGLTAEDNKNLDITNDYLFEKRRFVSSSAYGTPLRNLFLCGAGTYPGGTVTGAPGYNCAKEIIKLFSLVTSR